MSWGGLEFPHVWAGGVTLNDRAASPRARVGRITGWGSLAEMDDNRQTFTGRRGEIPLPSDVKGKTITYEGNVQAKTLAGLRTMERALRAGFRNRSDEQAMTIAGTRYFMARCISLEIDEEQTTGMQSVWPYDRTLTIGLRLSDARIYAVGQTDSIDHADGESVVLTTAGEADTDPWFNITTAGGTVTLYSGVLDKNLRFVGLPAGALHIDFKYRTVTVDGVDASGKLDVAFSDWWGENVPGLVPGDNNVGVTGGTWAASWRDAWE
jgi:phage-related protein